MDPLHTPRSASFAAATPPFRAQRAATGSDAVGTGWHAALELGYGHDGERTVITHRRHRGPLRVQKGFTPEGPGVWHQVIVHPPGGIAAGDCLELDIDVGAQASVLLTSPGAAKWYRCSDGSARQRLHARVAQGASLESLPLETILFSGAHARLHTRFDLAADARLIAAEVTCLGRPASGEPFDRGSLRSCLEVWRDGRLAFTERSAIEGGSSVLRAAAGLAGQPVFGHLLAAGPELGEAAVERLRDALKTVDDAGEAAVTLLDRIVLVRWRGMGAEDGWRVLRTAWAAIRPLLMARPACAPRIWAT